MRMDLKTTLVTCAAPNPSWFPRGRLQVCCLGAERVSHAPRDMLQPSLLEGFQYVRCDSPSLYRKIDFQ